jgi:MFS family permease
VNNLNDGMAWGLFPLLFAAAGMSLAEIGLLAAIYPAAWGVLQIGTGALSDRIGRKWLIAAGMWTQAAAIAAVSDVARPSWRASAVGVYRLWRDQGYVAGALLAGLSADLFGIATAIQIVAVITFASGLLAAVRMHETLRPERLWYATVPESTAAP